GPSATDACLEALESGEIGFIAETFANDLEAAACAMHPEIADAMSSLRTAGATGVSMSGSGSSVFALAESARRAREIAAALERRGFSAWAVHTLPQDML
ncbi:MAG: 4-(cytidine 5'-diphospho)-2-C-methyl-D-erythritol kinase, partial [Kiritimatiellae bacterium]|nr:4-(cytidine 5'-diphospho)-2-C-methyl-D-erythritol kinase [Kiritimatiellia bacterium]